MSHVLWLSRYSTQKRRYQGIIERCKTGLLFTDENGCAKAMQVAAKTDMQTMILAAQKYAVENFSEEKYGVHIINLYKEILKN